MASATVQKYGKLLPLYVAIILGAALLYGVGQQLLRQGANDPQVAMVSDYKQGVAVEPVSAASVAIDTSLQPFVMRFNKAGKLASSTGRLKGANPELPSGVLDAVRQDGQRRLTWQPATGVRIAAVVDTTDSGFVLVGRNLREVEARIDRLTTMLAIGTLFTLIAVTAAYGVSRQLDSK